MSAEVTPLAGWQATTWHHRARWCGLLALLPVEVLLLTLRFDTGSLGDETAWWALVLGAAPSLLRLGLAMTAATLLFGGADLWDELWRRGAAYCAPHRWGAFLVGHFGALAVFSWVTAVAFEGDLAQTSAFPAAWACAWFAAGLATVAFWALACLPARAHLRLLRRCRVALLVGAAAGGAAWGAGAAVDLLWEPLGRATLVSVRALLGLVFNDLVYEPAEFVVGTQAFDVRINPECSGYEGLGLMTVFLGAYLALFRRRFRFPAALLLFPLGAAAVWLLNSARIAALIAIGTWGWPDVALGGFHSQAGWLTFLAVALGIASLAGRVRWFAAGRPTAAAAGSPTVAYLAPFAALLLATMVGGAFAAGFDWLYPLRVLAAGGVLWYFRRSYAELSGPWSWQAVAFGVATFALWLVLAPAGAEGEVDPRAALSAAGPGWAAVWLAFRVLGHVLLVPLAEELAFRGYLIRRLMTATFLSVPPGRFSWFAFLGSSVLFGALHGRSWLAATLAGMAFALALRRRGRLIDAVVAHATANALLAVCAAATGRWLL